MRRTESCQAETSQATPPSQPQEIPRSQSQIFNHPNLSMCFSCVYVHIYMCMFVIFTQGKPWFTLKKSLVCSTASGVFLFPCQYHQYHRWQRAWRDRELYGQTQVSLCHTRDSSLLSRWMMRTRAPGKPCNPGKCKNIILAHSWFAKLKENKWGLHRERFLFLLKRN